MCVSPLRIPYPGKLYGLKGRFYLDVPCGHCFECLNSKRNDAIVKIYNELLECSSAYFVTLTYRQETVPEVHEIASGEVLFTLCYRDVQNWFKRSRRNCQYYGISTEGFRYFVCGEYGSKTLRPHYHVLLFNLSDSALNRFLADWQVNYGFVNSKKCDLSTQSAVKLSQYVSKYLTKSKLDCFAPRLQALYKRKCRSCFCRTSRFFGCLRNWEPLYRLNFGSASCLVELKNIYQFCKISINGFIYRMPKSIKKHFIDWCYEKKKNFKSIVSDSGLSFSRSSLERALATLSRRYFDMRSAHEFEVFKNQNRKISEIDIAYCQSIRYADASRCVQVEKRLASPLFFDHA